MRAKPTIWTADMIAKARRWHDEGVRSREIDRRLGVRRDATRAKLQLGRNPKRVDRQDIPHDVLVDREMRLAAANMRDQTSVFFGDPAPGYRALDGKTGQR